MKNIFTIFLIFIVQLSFSQTSDKYNFDQDYFLTIIDNDTDITNSDDFLKNLKIKSTQKDGNYKLDSIIADGFIYISSLFMPSKTYYCFDNKGNLLLRHIRILENDNWVNFWKYSFTYNENDDFLTLSYEIWENESWILYSETSYTYDSNGNKISYLKKSRANGVFSNYSKSNYTYDDNFNLIYKVNYKWENESWVNNYQQIWDYDEANNPTLMLMENWINDIWVNGSKSSYYYETNGSESIDSIFREIWTNEDWLPSFTEVSIYDENDNRLYYSRHQFDNGNFIIDFESTKEYNENNDLTHWIDFHLMLTIEFKEEGTNLYNENGQLYNTIIEKHSNGNWSSTTNNTNYFDENANIIESLQVSLINNIWENYRRYTYNYDDHGNVILSEAFVWEDENWVESNNLSVRIYYNNGNNSYRYPVYGYKAEAFYSEAIGVEELQDKNVTEFNCSPMPADYQTLISLKLTEKIFADISLFDITGKKLKTILIGEIEKGEHKFKIVTKDLKSGLYFINLTYKNHSYSSKLIINR